MAKFANVVQAKAEMSMTADQLAAAKEEHVQKVGDAALLVMLSPRVGVEQVESGVVGY